MSGSSGSPMVWIAVADGADAASLQPAIEMLKDFGIRSEQVAVTADGPMPTISGDVCAIIVASPDAALPAALAAHTPLPVLRVPMPGYGRSGTALLVENGNLPAGPSDAAFATMAIGEPGAKNAALFVVSSLATTHEDLRAAWQAFRARQTEAVLQHPPLEPED